MSRPPIISLFTGAGGLDGGLELAGFSVKVAVEPDPIRIRTLQFNKPKWKILKCRLQELTTEEILSEAGLSVGEPALVVGGSPCQPFSKSALWAGIKRNDPRAHLVIEFARVVSEAQPLGFVLENVPGLAGRLGGRVLNAARKILHDAGYLFEVERLNAADYGVPQKRQRVFVLGFRRDLGIYPTFPEKTHGSQTSRQWVTAGQAIGELDDGIVHEDEVPKGKWGHLLKLIPPGKNYLWLTERGGGPPIFRWRSRYWTFLLKLHPDLPSWTIQAKPGPCTGPFHWRNRKLRIPEVKRLQAFPDSWRLVGSPTQQWAQLGDATPFWLSYLIGRHIIIKLREAKLISSSGGYEEIEEAAKRHFPWLRPYVA